MLNIKDKRIAFTNGFLGVILTAVIIAGCTVQHQKRYYPAGLPEEVHLSPSSPQYDNPKIVVGCFAAPDYVRGIGRDASLRLYYSLLADHPGADIRFVDRVLFHFPEDIWCAARQAGADVVVTGAITFFLEGGLSHPSRVEQTMIVYGMAEGAFETIAYAKASAVDMPRPPKDYILLKDAGRPARAGKQLLEHNTDKFARLLNKLISKRNNICGRRTRTD